MSDTEFPNDENGRVIRLLLKNGDDLSEPREVSFHFLFPTRSHAVGFVEVMDDKHVRLELSWVMEYGSWQCNVVKWMRPTHHEITIVEEELISRAEPLEGSPDGWYCRVVES